MATTSCNYCGKAIQKGVKGKNNVYYCNQLHQVFGEPDRPIQGGLGALVVGVVLYLFLPNLEFRGTPLGLLFLIVGPIVLVGGLYLKFVKKSDQQAVSTANTQHQSQNENQNQNQVQLPKSKQEHIMMMRQTYMQWFNQNRIPKPDGAQPEGVPPNSISTDPKKLRKIPGMIDYVSLGAVPNLPNPDEKFNELLDKFLELNANQDLDTVSYEAFTLAVSFPLLTTTEGDYTKLMQMNSQIFNSSKLSGELVNFILINLAIISLKKGLASIMGDTIQLVSGIVQNFEINLDTLVLERIILEACLEYQIPDDAKATIQSLINLINQKDQNVANIFQLYQN